MLSAATSPAGRAVVDGAGADVAAVADDADAGSVAAAGVEGALVSWFDCDVPDLVRSGSGVDGTLTAVVGADGVSDAVSVGVSDAGVPVAWGVGAVLVVPDVPVVV
jgi:hypothetical protein